MFNIDFLACNLVSVRTGVEEPNMNNNMERFFRTVRKEALDNFLLMAEVRSRRFWRSTSHSTTVSDHIKGFSNRFRSLRNQRR